MMLPGSTGLECKDENETQTEYPPTVNEGHKEGAGLMGAEEGKKVEGRSSQKSSESLADKEDSQGHKPRGVKSTCSSEAISTIPESAQESDTAKQKPSCKQTPTRKQNELPRRLKGTTSISSLPRATSEKSVLNMKRTVSSTEMAAPYGQTRHAHPRVRPKLSSGSDSGSKASAKKVSDGSLETEVVVKPRAGLSSSHGGRTGVQKSLQRVQSPPGRLPPMQPREMKKGSNSGSSLSGSRTKEREVKAAVKAARSPKTSVSPQTSGSSILEGNCAFV